MPVRNVTDDLWKVLPKYSSTLLEKQLCGITSFDALLDPAVKVLRRAKGDWLGWHYDSDGKDLLNLVNDLPNPIFDGSWYIEDGDGNLMVDDNGDYLVNEPDYSRRFATTVDTTFLYWLAVEYGVNYLSEILPDISDRIAGGIQLNRIAGTPAAIKLIGNWLNFPEMTIIEEREPTIHFPEYQLDLGRYPTLDEVKTLVRSVRFGEPIRSRLRRVLYGCDRGRFLMDSSDWGDILDDYSGIRIDSLLDGQPQMKASFCRPLTFEVEQLAFQWDASHTST